MLKKKQPVTPSQRNTVLLKNNNLYKPTKSLTKGIKRNFGKNNQGRITVRHRGGGHKRLYRVISFDRREVNGIVQTIEYDPNRSANIALIENKELDKIWYILAPEGLEIGNSVSSHNDGLIKVGNSLPLSKIPLGSLIHNISLLSNKKGQLVRSAGTYGQLLEKSDNKFAKIRLMSGEQKVLSINCSATLGTVSNNLHKNIKIGKAGRSRWLNKRPSVRGVAKNPVDHPHGGGEGKTSGGRPSVTPRGIITKGKPTSNRKKKKYLIK